MKYPRTTQVLRPHSDWSMIPEEVLKAAAFRGEYVHNVCAAIARGLFVPKIPPEYTGYVESYRKWLSEAVEQIIFVEQEFFCD